MEAMISKASKLKAEQIKAWLAENVGNTDADVGLVFDAMLSALERKMTESEFVLFAEKLESLM